MNSKTIYNVNRNLVAWRMFPVILCLFILAGCEKTVDNIKLPATDPKLVVGCFISPQSPLITVTLTRSNPIFGPGHNNTNNQSVEDASVIISDGTNTASIPYDALNQQYELQTSSFPIVAAQTYSLTVSTPQGESVSASCTVPASNLPALTVDFTDTLSTSYPKKLTVNWQDISNELNYYKVFAQHISIDTFSLSDTIYRDFYGNNTLLNDHDKDGAEMYSKLESHYGYDGFSYKFIAYDIYILNIDAEYYKYQHSLDNYTYGDPFSEPSPLYTNIKGGLGIFAAYQQLYVRIP